MGVSGKLQPRLLYPQGRSPWYALNKKLCGLQNLSGCFGNETNMSVLPGINPQFLRYPDNSLVTIGTDLSQLLVLLQYLMKCSLAVNVLNSCWVVICFCWTALRFTLNHVALFFGRQTHTHVF